MAAKGIAEWDGTSWSTIWDSANFSPKALVIFDGNLVAGGSGVYSWNGTVWSALNPSGWPYYTMPYGVRSLTVSDGKLVAGGASCGIEWCSYYVVTWDGQNWIGNYPDYSGYQWDVPVNALQVHDSALFVGADYLVTIWDGVKNWHLGSGIDGSAYALTVFQDKLIVGGNFFRAGDKAAFNLATWTGGCRKYAGPVWHVDGAGNNTFGDGSINKPLASIDLALKIARTGDTVLVGSGTYRTYSYSGFDFGGKDIVLMSQCGPESTIVTDYYGSGINLFTFTKGETRSAVLKGFTIQLDTSYYYYRALTGIECRSSSPTIEGNVFSGGHTSYVTSAVYLNNSNALLIGNTFSGSRFPDSALIHIDSSTASIENCVFYGNYGTAVYLDNSSTHLSGNTFAGNIGGSIIKSVESSASIENCLISANSSRAIEADESAPVISCTDIFANSGGDWTGAIAAQAGQSGNLSVRPLFCNPEMNDFHVADSSQCAPSNNRCGTLIGALGVGCAACGQNVWHAAINGSDTTGTGSGEAPFRTIQRALSACRHFGDTVRVAPGVYGESLNFRGRDVVLISPAGPESTTVTNRYGWPTVFTFGNGETHKAVVKGFTIRSDSNNSQGGNAIECLSSSPTFEGNLFTAGSIPSVNCALYLNKSTARLIGNTFALFEHTGGSVIHSDSSLATIENCIISDNQCLAIESDESAPVISCTDIFGNTGGDWIGTIAGQAGQNGNISARPLFCAPGMGNFHLGDSSQCAPANNSCGKLIGALNVCCAAFGQNVWHAAITGNDTVGAGTSEAPFRTVQRALNTCSYFGDTVQVAPGAYGEHLDFLWQEYRLAV